MPSEITRRLRWLSAKLGFERDWYLVLIAAGIGLVMGSAATAFVVPLRGLEELASELADQPRWITLLLIAVLPAAGALLAGFVMHVIREGTRGWGVTGIIYAIHRGKSKLPFRVAIRKWLAATFTIGSGGSAGPEGPIVTIGSVIGSNIARLLKSNPQNTGTLLGCGAAAGIASVFNAPLAGIFFVLEILLRDFSLRTFTPIVVASVVSASWTQTILGENTALFGMGEGDFPQKGQIFTVFEIPNFLLLGLVCGALAALFMRLLFWTDDRFARLRVPSMLKPACGGALLGLMGLCFMLWAAPAVFAGSHLPPFYGSGYPAIIHLLDAETYLAGGDTLHPLRDMVLLLVVVTGLKVVATCLTIGSGGAGGLFAPSLLLGAGVGGLFGAVVVEGEWFVAANPQHYALVGMAAMIAATSHAPLTGILIVYEITRSYEIVLPLMLAAVISTVAARLITRDSVYTWKLTRMGVRLGAMSDLTILRRLAVQDVPLAPAVSIHQNESASRLLELSEQHAVGDFVAVDDNGSYVGMVTGADLRAALVYREAIPLLQVSELLRADLPTVTPDEPLDVVLDKFSRHDVQSLAVLGSSNGSVLGLITRARLMRQYQSALSKD